MTVKSGIMCMLRELAGWVGRRESWTHSVVRPAPRTAAARAESEPQLPEFGADAILGNQFVTRPRGEERAQRWSGVREMPRNKSSNRLQVSANQADRPRELRRNQFAVLGSLGCIKVPMLEMKTEIRLENILFRNSYVYD